MKKKLANRTKQSLAWTTLILVMLSTACSSNDSDEEGENQAVPAPIVIPEIAEFSEPTSVALNWVTHEVNTPDGSDPVYASIEDGTFEYPRGGLASDGTFWDGFEAGDNGELRGPENKLLYAVGRAVVNPNHYYFARADSVYRVFYGQAQQPGDLYGSGRRRIPLLQYRGELAVAVQIGQPRGTPALQVFTTENELYFNSQDTITPEVVEGDDSEQFIGMTLLNLRDIAALDVRARVEANEYVNESIIYYPSLAPAATTQLAFSLKPKDTWPVSEEPLTFRLIVESPSLNASYATTIEINTVASGTTHKRSFRSSMDGSAQYYGVVVPTGDAGSSGHGLVLSLHGAAVEGIGQARAYHPKDWGYVIAPTNRRPFGFDWQSWGRLDALESLDDAALSFSTDPTRVYLTGHSMGGHGTWHVGVMHPGRFAVMGPSAGWSSFMSYSGSEESTGAWGRAAAHNDTMDYITNFSRRGIYIIHGDADDNVPVREGRDMYEAVSAHTDDIYYHEQPGAGHWWDGEASAGADCVDWPPLFDLMTERRLDPYELEFDFKSPTPSTSATHSYVTLHAANSPYEDMSLTASASGSNATLSTANVLSLSLQGDALLEQGITSISVNGETLSVEEGEMRVGSDSQKDSDSYGPFNQVLERPFVLVYPDDGHEAYRRYAAYLLSNWSVTGNGHGAALGLSELTDAMRAQYNIIYIGVPQSDVPETVTADIEWSTTAIRIGDRSETGLAAVFVQPSEAGGLFGVMTATEGKEAVLFRYQPFASRFSAPDFFTFGKSGASYSGFFDAQWQYQSSLVQ